MGTGERENLTPPADAKTAEGQCLLAIRTRSSAPRTIEILVIPDDTLITVRLEQEKQVLQTP
jgi:hypothetical protein